MRDDLDVLKIIGRKKNLYDVDIKKHENKICSIINSSSFLVIGGAGSIGQAVTKEIFKRNPKKLHVVDISENNLVELVRDIRSSIGYIDGDFRTFAIDCGSIEYEAFFRKESPYDYVLNLSALKHVRSEEDPYTLMRMIDVNIINTIKTINLAKDNGVKKYFCVSTDKAANPANMMGASKRIMEMFLIQQSKEIKISTARFANVAFSDGSLLHGFVNRVSKSQPIAAPNDILRYFVTSQESGELCLMSCLFGENNEIFFPKLDEKKHLQTFSLIATRYLEQIGFQAEECQSEEEARSKSIELIAQKKWPCYFFKSDTTGEKSYEEFYTDNEIINNDKFYSIGIVKNSIEIPDYKLDNFLTTIKNIKNDNIWKKQEIIHLFNTLIKNFNHIEKGKFLDQKM